MIVLARKGGFILKVDPRKRILFNPAESIELQGNTGPFIQYTNTRIRSMLRLVVGFEIREPDQRSQEVLVLRVV